MCDITVEPLPRGGGFEFVDKVVGGSVPRQFIPSVEKGVRAQLERGCLAGFPVVDLRVTLTDGKAHSVDSSDMAFQTAGALALRDAASEATVTLLEPVRRGHVVVDDEHVGPVMTDLQTRRGRVLGTEPDGTGWTTVHAEVPESEIVRYAIDLRSVSHGTGDVHPRAIGYEQMPPQPAPRRWRSPGPTAAPLGARCVDGSLSCTSAVDVPFSRDPSSAGGTPRAGGCRAAGWSRRTATSWERRSGRAWTAKGHRGRGAQRSRRSELQPAARPIAATAGPTTRQRRRDAGRGAARPRPTAIVPAARSRAPSSAPWCAAACVDGEDRRGRTA